MGRSSVKDWVTFKFHKRSPSGKTKIWRVHGVGVRKEGGGGILGHVHWFGRWRKYAFMPRANTVFEKDCLRLIAGFCEQQTKIHNAALRTARKKK